MEPQQFCPEGERSHFSVRTFALPKKGTNAGAEVRSQLLVECRTANDRTQAAIDRNYRECNLQTDRELGKRVKI
jgi:hypothetical protein